MKSKLQLKALLLIFLIKSTSTKTSKICKLLNNNRGICVNSRNCPHMKHLNSSSTDCMGDLICCPTSSRIVTPDTSIPFSIPSFPISTITPCTTTSDPQMTSSLPLIDTTMSTTGEDIATAKCLEYKRRVVKRDSITTYVFGGTETKSKEFPHMAALGYGHPSNPEWLCGGSLISEQYVVTAAHCLVLSTPGSLVVVRLGDINLKSTSDDVQSEDFGIAETILHPQYQLPQQYNDIALIKLDRLVNFNQYIAPICLQTSYVLPNTNFIATGWGRTETTGQPSDTLMQVNLDYFPNNVCQNTFAQVSLESLPNGITDHNQICAGSYSEEKDTCQGDSGGPLQIKYDDTLYLVGITSFGLACGIPNSPAVYTRVSFYMPWIEKNVWS